MEPENIPPPPDGGMPPPTNPVGLNPKPSQQPPDPSFPVPDLTETPLDSPTTPDNLSKAKANPLPFLLLVALAILGTGLWIGYKRHTEHNYTAGKAAEKPLKAFRGNITKDGAQFTGIWKGNDNDEDEPTNWEIIRHSDSTFTAFYKKDYEDGKYSKLLAKGKWMISGSKIKYKILKKELDTDGPAQKWPESWEETIGNIENNRIIVQSKKTPSRRGPYTENRVAGFLYPQMTKNLIPTDFKQIQPGQTEEPSRKVPSDLLVHYDFNGTSKNLADQKYEATFIKARLTDKNLPESFGKAVYLEAKDSFVEIKQSDSWNLAVEDFTISLWLRIKGSRTTGYGILDSISNQSSNSLTGIGLHTIGQGKPGAIEFLFYHRDARYRFRGWTPVNDGEWHHLAVTKSGHLVQMYVDGQPEGKLSSIFRRSGFGTTTLALGKFLDTGLPGGAIDNFRLYKRTLNPSEALAIYKTESSPQHP
ncbi:MAG: LamG domain-containing protein [Opitutae bacterium]|nr:LamG domain-containing protein [Opitutae bacterium]